MKEASSGECLTTMEIPIDNKAASIDNVEVIHDGDFCVVIDKNVSTASPLQYDRWIKPMGVQSVEYLLVGGGGAGGPGSCNSCGGGAGGQVLSGSISTTTKTHLAILAGWGAGEASKGASLGSCIASESLGTCAPTSGSTTAQLLAYAYGGPNGSANNAATSPVYGGGGGAVTGLGGVPPAGSGFKGGDGFAGGGAGGGSGACGAGQNATATSGGAGGVGCSSSITGTLAYYGVGGGGAGKCSTCTGGVAPNSSGSGGSAARPLGSPGVPPYFGSGGGGSYNGQPARGANGVVILRYASVQPPAWLDQSVSFGSACSRVISDGILATGSAPITYSVVPGGVLPKGLSLKANGSGFIGVPEPSSYNFALSASNAAGTIYTQQFVGSIRACANIQIDSVTGPGIIRPGGSGSVTITAANRLGPNDAPDTTLTYRIPDEISVITPLPNGCVGTITITCGPTGPLPYSPSASSADRSWTFGVSVSSSFVSGTTSNGLCSVSTSVTDTSSQDPTDPDLSNNSIPCNFTVSAASADMRISAMPDANEKTTYAPSSSGSRTFKIENVGPSDAVNPTFEFVVNPSNIAPTGTVLFSSNGSTAGNWTCATPSGSNPTTLSCSSSTPMQKGASTVVKVGTLADNSPHGTQVTSTATVGSLTTDPLNLNNTLSSMLMVVDLRPDLNISGFFESSTVTPGTSTKLHIRVGNSGSISSNGPTTASFTLPAGLVLDNGEDVPARCTSTSSTITCTDSSGLAAPIAPSTPGGFIEFVIPVSIGENAASDSNLSLIASVPAASTSDVSASGGETNLWNNSATITLLVGPPLLDLQIGVSRPRSTIAGATALIQMTVTNNGPSSASNYTLRYDLPLKVSVSGNLPTSCTAAGRTISCIRSSTFAKGSIETFEITVIVDDSSLTGLTEYGSMEVTSTSRDLVPSNNKATVIEANLDVVGAVIPAAVTTTTSTVPPVTSTTTTSTTLAPKKVKVLAVTGFSSTALGQFGSGLLLLGVVLVLFVTRRRLNGR